MQLTVFDKEHYERVIKACSFEAYKSDVSKARQLGVFWTMVLFLFISSASFIIGINKGGAIYFICLLTSLIFMFHAIVIRSLIKDAENNQNNEFMQLYTNPDDWHRFITYLVSEHYFHTGGLTHFLDNWSFWILTQSLGQALVWGVAKDKRDLMLAFIFFFFGLLARYIYLFKREFKPSRSDRIKLALNKAKKYINNPNPKKPLLEL